MMEQALLFAVGLAAGLLGGLLGIGGGLVTIPSFLFLFHLYDLPDEYAMQTAVGTALGVMVFLGGSSTLAHARKKGVLWRFLSYFAPGVVLGAVFGALIDDLLPSYVLQKVFSVYVLFFGVRFLLPKRGASCAEEDFTLPSGKSNYLMGILTGSLSAALGIGGATFTIPYLTHNDVPMHRAISTSACVSLVVAVTGSLSFLYFGLDEETAEGTLGYIYLPGLLFSGIGSVLTAPLGAKLAYRLPVGRLKQVFGLFMLIVGIILW